MTQHPTTLVLMSYVVVFVGVLLLFEGLRQMMSRRETGAEARNRRMKLVRRGATPEEVLAQLFYREHRGRRFGVPDIGKTLRQAGLPFGVPTFLLGCVGVGAAAFVAMSRYMQQEIAAPLAVASAVLVPLAVIDAVRRKRMEKLVLQLPDALDLMGRGLKVGHPLNVTVGSVAREMADPIGTEFGLVVDQVSYGTDITEAFADFADRVDLEDVRYLAVAVGIQHGTGGNLARVLSVLSKVIRDRATMKRRIHAISSEGRLSAFILSVLPFGIFGSIMSSTPTYYMDVRDDPAFLPTAIAIVGLVVAQALILRKLVTFKF
jgi:tight adherence protein B